MVILPEGAAFTEEGYALEYVHQRISTWLERQGIPHLSRIEEFDENASAFYDESDHFDDAGNQRMAGLMQEFLLSMEIERVPPHG